MSATAILDQRKNFKSGYEYGYGSDGASDKDKNSKKEIDCSHLVNSILVGAGYRIPYESTAALESSSYYDVIAVDDVIPGDLILWRKAHKHVGIVESIDLNPATKAASGTFFGSQSSTGPASTKFGPSTKEKYVYWSAPADKFLRPKSEYYHGKDSARSTEPVPPAPPKTEAAEQSIPSTAPAVQPSRKETLEDAKRSTDAVRAKWAEPVPEDEEEDTGYATRIPMDSGLFPIGMNLTWHGGIHVRGQADQPVLCMFDGEVVAARLPEKDPQKLAFGSRNFVLIKHKSPNGDVFWSLYMHLLPILLKDDDPAMAEAMPWLYDLQLTTEGGGSSNFRPTPSTAAAFDPPRTAGSGELFSILDKRQVENLDWYQVRSNTDGVQGWIAKTSRVKLVPKIHELDSLKAGKVTKFSHPILAGACVGFVSSPSSETQPFAHVEVFSESLAKGGWIEVKDDDANDVVCDAEGLKCLLNKTGDAQFLEPITPELIQAAYANQETRLKMWVRAYRFKSEWAVDWEDALQRYDKDEAKLHGPEFNKYAFWKDAEAAGCDLPKGGMVYHYQPLVFKLVAYPRATENPPASGADSSELNIDWGFIAKMEGIEKKVYVPNKKGVVLGKSGPTVASGFDLGQIDKSGFDAYSFSDSIQEKLEKFVGKKGSIALEFVKANPTTLTDDELKEVQKKVKGRHGKSAEKFFNAIVQESGTKFKERTKAVQTVYASAYFQYGVASKTLRAKLVENDLVGAIDTLLHYTTRKEEKVYKKVKTSVMEYLRRRIEEADYLLESMPDGKDRSSAKELIDDAKKTWKDATGEQL